MTVLVSIVTEPISEEHLYRLTFWSRHSTKVRVDLDQDTQYSPDEIKTTGKGTSINDVPRFLAFFDLPTYLCPIWSLLEKAAYLMTSFFV